MRVVMRGCVMRGCIKDRRDYEKGRVCSNNSICMRLYKDVNDERVCYKLKGGHRQTPIHIDRDGVGTTTLERGELL